jgi:hypothetical protein
MRSGSHTGSHGVDHLTRLVLVEHAPGTFRTEPDDLVVALTAEACYPLDRQGVPYKLTTDFGTDAEIAALEPLHWQEQLAWIDALDEVIAAHVPATKTWRFGAATLHAYRLKLLVDPVRVRALELEAMLGSCERVILHRRASTEPSPTSEVLSLLAHERGLEFEERIVDVPELEDAPAIVSSSPPAGLLERVETRLRLGYQRLFGAQRRRPEPAESQLTLLFADFGYDLAYLLTRARERGHRCLRVVGDAVVEERADRAEVARLPTERVDPSWISVAQAVASPDHPLWAWPNSWFPGAPLADVLRPRIVDWLERVMPRIAARAASFDGLLRAENVDFLVAANPGEPDMVSAAAVTAPPTQSVLVDHGHRAHASALFDLIMLRHVDHNFCATAELARYLESRRALYDHPTAELHVGSYQWRANAALSRSGEPPEPVPTRTPVVVYALAATAGSARYLNGEWYSDGWYYRLCREIVDVLALHPEVYSVVKLFPGDGVARNPIDRYVDDLGLDHVVSSRAPLRTWIPWADRMIFDYPSTGLYEAAVAGVPYLSLLYRHHRCRPEAVEQLGAAAVPFTEPAEAARAVESFVAARVVTAPRLDPEGDEILLVLERLAQR